MSRLKLSLPATTGIALIAFSFVVLSNTHYFESTYSLMERGFFLLSLALLWRLLFFKSGVIPVSLPLVLLVLVMGLSVTQFLQSYIAQDFIGAAAVAMMTVVYASALTLNNVVRSIAIGGAILGLWSLWELFFSPLTSWAEIDKFIGPYTHWNSLGLSLLLGVAAIVSAKFSETTWLDFLLRLGALTIVGIPIYLSQSRNSWVTFVLVVIAGFILWVYRMNKKAFVGVLVVALGILAVTLFNSQWVLNLLQKDSSISGRTGIWQAASHHIWDKPWLGYGWSRLFPPDSIIGGYITTESQIPANHSHNDLLNWYLTTGVFGLLLVVVLYFTVVRSGILALEQHVLGASWLLIGAIQLITSGLIEITSFQLQGWFIFCLLSSTAAAWFVKERNKRNVLNVKFSIPVFTQ